MSPFYDYELFKKFRKGTIPSKDRANYMKSYFKNLKLLEDHELDSDYMFIITSKRDNFKMYLKFPILKD